MSSIQDQGLMDEMFGNVSSSSSSSISKNINTINVKEAPQIPDVKEGLSEYFKLKVKYETQILVNKKKIMNNPTLSNREKRSEYLKLKPKCINCKRPGGTIFKINYFSETDREEGYRQYSSICGIIADPCNLDIKINVGKVELLPNLLNSIQKEIKELKNTVIDYKNKLLFGYLTTEEALENFEELKENISFYNTLYEAYLENYNLIFDNDELTRELNENILNSYTEIQQIKECIQKMNETDNTQYARDAVNIYNTTLIPILQKIRMLKYNENMVVHNEDTNTCNLIQNKYSIQKMSYSSYQSKVISYNVGLEFIRKKKPGLIIESSTVTPDSGDNFEEPRIIVNPTIGQPSGEIPRDDPVYGKGEDGISWNIPEYKTLWNNLPMKLKNVLRPNNEWMSEFMFQCVNSRSKKEKCKFIKPPELIIPPQQTSNGQYDFGVEIYNEEFSKLPKNLQQTYLTFYSEKDGVKNYSMLLDSINELVEKAVEFRNGYF